MHDYKMRLLGTKLGSPKMAPNMWMLFGQHAQPVKNNFLEFFGQYFKAKRFYIKSQSFSLQKKNQKIRHTELLLLYRNNQGEHAPHPFRKSANFRLAESPPCPTTPPVQGQHPCNFVVMAVSLTIRVTQSHGSKVNKYTNTQSYTVRGSIPSYAHPP